MARGPKRIRLARNLRQRPVPAEAILWQALRNRALAGYKFRRQHPIGPYVVDFACAACKLVIELDGVSHLGQERGDERRSELLRREGWCVLRFWNTEIYEELDPVKEAIYQKCVARSEPRRSPLTPNPSPPADTATKGTEYCRAGGEGSPRPQRKTSEPPSSAGCVEPNHEQALKVAEAAVLTFKKK